MLSNAEMDEEGLPFLVIPKREVFLLCLYPDAHLQQQPLDSLGRQCVKENSFGVGSPRTPPSGHRTQVELKYATL